MNVFSQGESCKFVSWWLIKAFIGCNTYCIRGKSNRKLCLEIILRNLGCVISSTCCCHPAVAQYKKVSLSRHGCEEANVQGASMAGFFFFMFARVNVTSARTVFYYTDKYIYIFAQILKDNKLYQWSYYRKHLMHRIKIQVRFSESSLKEIQPL